MNPIADAIIQQIEEKKQKWHYKRALKIALEWLNSHRDDYRFYEELADIYLYEENIEKAEEVIRYARELHPNSGTGIYLEGYILTEKWEFEAAIEVFKKANALFPNTPEILRVMGWCHVMIGSMQQGIALLRRAKTLAPDDEKITQNLNMATILYETLPDSLHKNSH